MIYLLIFGFLIIALLSVMVSSSNVRKAHQAELEALRKAQKDAEFDRKLVMRKASLMDELRGRDAFGEMSENQLSEHIESSLRGVKEARSVLGPIGGFLAVVGAAASAYIGFQNSSFWLFVGGAVGAFVVVVLVTVYIENLILKQFAKDSGLTDEQLKID